MRIAVTVLSLWMLALPLAARAGDDAGNGDRKQRRDRWRRFGQIFRKLRAGEKLTQDEQAVVDQADGRIRQVIDNLTAQAQQGGGNDAGAPRAAVVVGRGGLRSGDLEYGKPGELNVRNFARFRLADLDLVADKADDAIITLSDVHRRVRSGPTHSLAAYNLGLIFLKHKNDAAKARGYLYQVTGDLAARARQLVVGPLVQQGDTDAAIAELQSFFDKAKEALIKAGIIRQMEQILSRAGDQARLRTFLAGVPRMITKLEADKAAKQEAKQAKQPPLGGVINRAMRNWQGITRGGRGDGGGNDPGGGAGEDLF